MPLFFEWDPVKARRNKEKHDVTFDEASTAFEDPLSQTIPDPVHSRDETRFVLIGASHRGRLVVVVHTDTGDRVRIISARRATAKERRQYEEDAER
ncbi:MAG: BrnT family toxin [Candidatus Hydrogenedentota bacterium]